MIIDYFILIIFLISLGGIFFILYRKIPILLALSENENYSFQVSLKFLRTKEWLEKKIPLFFYKILSYSKIFLLKIEIILDALLQKLRKNFCRKKENK